MKKLTALSLSTASFLSLATPAFAVTNTMDINICAGGRFKDLCNLAEGNLGNLITSIIFILFFVAILLALAFLIFGGIKWVISGGDKTKVEAARGTIVASLVGLAIVFLAYFVITILMKFFGVGLGSVFHIPSLGV